MIKANPDNYLARARIVYVIGSLRTGGAEGQLYELVRRLDTSRFETSIVLFDMSTMERARTVTRRTFSLNIPQAKVKSSVVKGHEALKAFSRLVSYLWRRKPHIVHAFLPAACELAIPAGLLVRTPVLIGGRRSLHDVYRTHSKVHALCDRVASRLSHVMLANAESVSRDLLEFDRLRPERVTTIYNGVDLERFRPGLSRNLRREHGWEDRHVVFGMVANFHAYKRHIDFVQAAAILARKFPDSARFLMTGDDWGALEGTRSRIRDLGLEGVCHIISPATQPEPVYSAVDIYVCSSETEGFSNVILEAMACGKPVIATGVGGNPEAVINGETGFIVPVRCPEEIARCGELFVASDDLRREMGRNGRLRAEQHFSVERMVRKHEILYRKLLAGRGLDFKCAWSEPVGDEGSDAVTAGSSAISCSTGRRT
jgi:glycosyltransferase involved in cell wall biosynthesis